MKNNIVITDEMLQRIHTDSDILDLAEELNVSYKELDFAISMKCAEGTPCYGCKHIIMMYSMYPCTCCSRNKKDMFEPVN